MHHHDHTSIPNGTSRTLFWAMIITGTFMVVEFVGGYLTGSLALIADASHMLIDAAALALAWGAARMAMKPPDIKRSYGYQRFQVIAAFVNGLTLLVLVSWIIFEAIERLFTPSEVLAGPMLVIAVIGFLVNLVVFSILHRGNRDNLNVQGALLHVLGDLLGSVAAISAAIIIIYTGWMMADPLLSLIVAALILRSAWSLVRKAAHILMEGTPDGINIDSLKSDLMEEVNGLEDVHHIHVWLLTSDQPLLTMHVKIYDMARAGAILLDIKDYLRRQHGIGHSTIQIEDDDCADH